MILNAGTAFSAVHNQTAAFEVPDLAPETVAGSTWLTTTMTTMFLLVGVLLLFALVVRIFCIPRWRKRRRQSVLQILLESMVDMFEKEGQATVGGHAKFLAPWYFGACALIFLGILSELLGFRPPLSDLNITLALGLSTYLFMWFFGLKERKLRYFARRHILLLTDAVVPFSMALRLFASVFSGYVIMHLLYSLLPAVGYVLVSPFAAVMTTLLHALMQTYVFMMLSYVFIADAME